MASTDIFATARRSAGLLGATIPERYGGAGMGMLESGLVLEAFSKWNHAFGLSWVAHDNLCANNIYLNGDRSRSASGSCPKLCSGEWVGCLGLTEPGAGSDALGSMRTRAERDGDGYVVNGAKLFITNGSVADVCLFYAKTQPGEGSKGITAFVVETDDAGVRGRPEAGEDGLPRQSRPRSWSSTTWYVPSRERGRRRSIEGHRVVMSGLDFERAMIAPINVGMAARALELSVEYAKTREQFGASDRPVPDGPVTSRRHVRVGRDDDGPSAGRCWPRSTGSTRPRRVTGRSMRAPRPR